MNEDFDRRLTKVETIVEDHSKLLQKQQEKNEVQTELNTLLKMQIETNKEQNKQMERFGQTLDKVNSNLTNLNNQQQNINVRLSDVEEVIKDQNINTGKVFKGVLKQIGIGVCTIIVAYFLYKLGISSEALIKK